MTGDTLRDGLAAQGAGDPSRPDNPDYDRALELFDQAIAAGRDLPRAYNARWHIRYLRGDLDGARDDLDRAIAAAPDLAQAWYHRGLVHQRDGRAPAALNDFRRALRLARDAGDDELEDAIDHHLAELDPAHPPCE